LWCFQYLVQLSCSESSLRSFALKFKF
jgi:hypothetical protein